MRNYIKNSPIEKYSFYQKRFYLKRDDLLRPLEGNKARKLSFLLDGFDDIETIVSYGSPFSNAMVALAKVAKIRGWKFIYYSPIDKKLFKNPKGNLKRALDLGMEVRFKKAGLNIFARSLKIKSTLFIPEGARCKEASSGIKILAKEIEAWGKDVSIFLPSGTGVMALYLQKYLPYLTVYTTPCVGGSTYLKAQWIALEPTLKRYPTIIDPPKKYRFGKPYLELFKLWQELKEQTGIEFDLLYDMVGWMALLENWPKGELLYIHQGGLGGNETMIERYKKKFVTIEENL